MGRQFIKDVRATLEDGGYGNEALMASNPEAWNSLMSFIGGALGDGAVPAKYKELIAVGISAYSRCEYCIVGHVRNALQAGCTRQEILEAATVATAFGGGPTMAYSSAILVAALDEFEKEFQ